MVKNIVLMSSSQALGSFGTGLRQGAPRLKAKYTPDLLENTDEECMSVDR